MNAYIRRPTQEDYLRIDIEPSGMSVCWTQKEHATPFGSVAEATKFAEGRLRERYTEPVVVVGDVPESVPGERFHFTAEIIDADENVVQTFRIPWQEDEPAPDVIITGDLVTLALAEIMPDSAYRYRKAIVCYVSEPSWWLAQSKEPDPL